MDLTVAHTWTLGSNKNVMTSCYGHDFFDFCPMKCVFDYCMGQDF